MKREYSTGTHDKNPDFFIGKEVEHTLAYEKLTLFCHGELTLDQILEKLEDYDSIDHIYLNHNHTPLKDRNNKIYSLLDLGYYVTYEICVGTNRLYLEHDRLIHLYSLVVPKANWKNLYIKIDDEDFDDTNPGVWTFYAPQLKDHFTPWSAYQDDEIL